MSYLINRAAIRIKKNLRQYIFIILQIMIGICVLDIAFNTYFYAKNKLDVIISSTSDKLVPIQAYNPTDPGAEALSSADIGLLRAKFGDAIVYSYETSFYIERGTEDTTPVSLIIAGKSFFRYSLGMEEGKYRTDTIYSGDNIYSAVQQMRKITCNDVNFFDSAEKKIFGISLADIKPLDGNRYNFDSSYGEVSYNDALIVPIEICEAFTANGGENIIGQLSPKLSIAVNPDDVSETEQLCNEVTSYLKELHPESRYSSVISALNAVKSTSEYAKNNFKIAQIIAFIILTMVILGFAGLMLLIVHRRRREHAISLMCGATYMMLVIEMLAETGIITIFGTTLGIIAGTVITAIPAFSEFIKTQVSIYSALICVAVALVITAITCLITYGKIKSVSPVQILADI